MSVSRAGTITKLLEDLSAADNENAWENLLHLVHEDLHDVAGTRSRLPPGSRPDLALAPRVSERRWAMQIASESMTLVRLRTRRDRPGSPVG
jgi:hypothetical protein